MKTNFLLAISLLISSFAFSQEQVEIGIRAGVISSGISGDANKSLNQLLDKTNGILQTSDRTGFFTGVNADIPVAKNFSVESGVYYTQKGYNLKGEFDLKGAEFLGANAGASLRNQYVEVPLLLKGNVGGFQVFAGPQVSYLIQSDLKATAGIFGISLLNKTIETIDQFNRWDASLTGGIGYQLSNGVNIMASYDYGLMKLDKNKSIDAFNRGIKLGIGINL